MGWVGCRQDGDNEATRGADGAFLLQSMQCEGPHPSRRGPSHAIRSLMACPRAVGRWMPSGIN